MTRSSHQKSIFYHSLHEEKKTHFRTWKSGKKWVYASTALMLTVGGLSDLTYIPGLSALTGPAIVHAVTTTASSGTFSNGCPWSIDTAGNLTIGTAGSTTPYTFSSYLSSYFTGTSLTAANIATINFASPVKITYNAGTASNIPGMFSGFTSLTTVTGMSNIDVSGVTSFGNFFAGDTALTSIDVSSWNTSNATTMYSLFSGDTALQTITGIGKWNVSKVVDFSSMFISSGVTSLDLSAWSLNTSSSVNMANMFESASKLTTLNTTGWNTSKVTSMSNMFNGTSSLTSIPGITSWNVSSVTSFLGMFNSTGLPGTLDLSGWTLNTSSAVDMTSMFNNARGLTSINTTGWNTSQVTNTSQMFVSTTSLTGVPGISGWNLAKDKVLSDMFNNSSISGSLDLSAWHINSATTLARMFDGASNLVSLNVTGWNTSNVTTTNSMFLEASSLSALTGIGNWQLPNDTDFSYMFGTTPALRKLDLSGWTINATALTNSNGLSSFLNTTGLVQLTIGSGLSGLSYPLSLLDNAGTAGEWSQNDAALLTANSTATPGNAWFYVGTGTGTTITPTTPFYGAATDAYGFNMTASQSFDYQQTLASGTYVWGTNISFKFAYSKGGSSSVTGGPTSTTNPAGFTAPAANGALIPNMNLNGLAGSTVTSSQWPAALSAPPAGYQYYYTWNNSTYSSYAAFSQR